MHTSVYTDAFEDQARAYCILVYTGVAVTSTATVLHAKYDGTSFQYASHCMEHLIHQHYSSDQLLKTMQSLPTEDKSWIYTY